MGRVNCTIRLLEDQMEIFSGHRGKWITANALVSLRLTPTIQVLIEISDVPITFSGNLYNYGKVTKVRLPGGPDVETRTVRVELGKTRSSTLEPTWQPMTSVKKGVHLQSVRFHILNFPSLHQRPAVLQEGPWHIEIRPCQDLQVVKNALNAESGFGLTHEGTLKRSDSRSFPVEAAEKVIQTLHLFLSFARGGSCGITLIKGSDESGDKVWEQWGAYTTYPWFRLSSWLDHWQDNDAELAQAFPGFFKAMMKGEYSVYDRVPVALYWYLRSNESNSPYSGIVLTQAALERWSRDALSDKESSNVDKKTWLSNALKNACTDTNLPASCKELTAMSKTDGPRTLADARNDLVHANVGEGLSWRALMEARDLGQWYAELLLLKKFKYQGRYANRLRYAYEGMFSPEVVPWAR